MSRTNGIQITWPTGFSFVIDFINPGENINEKLLKWENFYSTRERKPEISIASNVSSSYVDACNRVSISCLTQIFEDLSCQDKIAVVEMVKENCFSEV